MGTPKNIGTIHRYFVDKGYGFIRHREKGAIHDSEKFFHCSQCVSGFVPLEGKEVAFNLVYNKDNRIMAVEVEDAPEKR